MQRPVLYHDPTSEPSRAVHWFALEANIDIDIELTWLVLGDHQSAEYLCVNPMRQVPALTHGEFRLAESVAIMVYLAEINGIQDCWIADSPRGRAKTHQIMSWHHTNTRSAITLNYLLPVLLMPAYNGAAPPSADACRLLRSAALDSLKNLDRIIAERGQFLGGDEPSIADFFIASDLFALDIDPSRDSWFSECPVVRNWLGELRLRDGYLASHSMWNSVVPPIRELVASESTEKRNPEWIADFLKGNSNNL